MIESASIEKRTIETSQGKSTQQPCLVVRIRHTPGEQFWIRPTGLEFTGKQESYFDEIGKYTGVFWPILPEDALHSLSGIELISLRDLKKTAEQQGYILNLDSLTTPSSDDVAFPPLVAPQSNAARPL